MNRCIDTNPIDPRILEDADRIRNILPNLRSVALFGSCTWQSPDVSNDVDLALFMDGPQIGSVERALRQYKFNFDLKRGRISASYSGGGGISAVSPAQKAYDIVVLDHDHPDEQFMKRSRDTLVYLP